MDTFKFKALYAILYYIDMICQETKESNAADSDNCASFICLLLSFYCTLSQTRTIVYEHI